VGHRVDAGFAVERTGGHIDQVALGRDAWQRAANDVPKNCAPGSEKSVTRSSPRVQRKPSALKKTLVACAALRARRQREQWQYIIRIGMPVIS
jgi:hypothetical protein